MEILLLLLLINLLANVSGKFEEHDPESFSGYARAEGRHSRLLWGPYRPNLYMGIRPRLPDSILTGLTWATVDGADMIHQMRHTYEVEHNVSCHWSAFDPYCGGRQMISDPGMNIDIETSLAKFDEETEGNSWALRVHGYPRINSSNDAKFAFFFHVAMENQTVQDTHYIRLQNKWKKYGLDGDVQLSGNSPELGNFTFVVTEPKQTRHPISDYVNDTFVSLKTQYTCDNIPAQLVWQGEKILSNALLRSIQSCQQQYGEQFSSKCRLTVKNETSCEQANYHILQKVFTGEFTFDILFASKGHTLPKVRDLRNKFEQCLTSFKSRFSEIFILRRPFKDDLSIKFAQTALSNILGSIGYFVGPQIVDRNEMSSYDDIDWDADHVPKPINPTVEGPHKLFTAIPNRPFFPRGFYWDEGFHLLPVAKFDMNLSMEIVESWLSLMDKDGWIAREQILGMEAHDKVPKEFQVQSPYVANPPTLLFEVNIVIDHLKQSSLTITSDNQLRSEFEHLERIYPLLQRHYEWFRRTQRGQIKLYDREAFSNREGYRWFGRTATHCLPSGLDDYPRPIPPHQGELNVDLISWMSYFTRTLRRLAVLFGDDKSVQYRKIEYDISKNIDDLHWSEKEQCYCDATIDENGYISIFPLLLGVLSSDSPHVEPLLNLMLDREEIWSQVGLRSLSKRHPFFGQGDDYWRGASWLPINYLALASLQNIYAKHPTAYQAKAKTLYNNLRENVVNAVLKEWKRTGSTWENYDSRTGRGRGAHPFDGWTGACTLMIMAEYYPNMELSQLEDSIWSPRKRETAGEESTLKNEL